MFFSHPGWIETVGKKVQSGSYLKGFRLAFFSWPDLYMPVFRAWAYNMPILGIALGLAIVWQIIRIRKRELGAVLCNPVLPILIVITTYGFFPPIYSTTRYSYFLYPLLLCVFLLSCYQIGNLISKRLGIRKTISHGFVLSGILILFFISEDFNISHILNLRSEEVHYRMGRFERYSLHWYTRRDYLRPAEMVNKYRTDNDRVIVSSSIITVSAYLNDGFAVFCPREDVIFPLISREKGTLEIWSNHRLLSTSDDVMEYTFDADTVWLIVLDEVNSEYLDPDLLWPDRIKSLESFKPGYDKRIKVLRIDLKK
jgi:hypothetical protein